MKAIAIVILYYIVAYILYLLFLKKSKYKTLYVVGVILFSVVYDIIMLEYFERVNNAFSMSFFVVLPLVFVMLTTGKKTSSKNGDNKNGSSHSGSHHHHSHHHRSHHSHHRSNSSKDRHHN